MNKGEFIKALAEKSDITVKQADAVYDAAYATIADALKAGDKVALAGFGTFELKAKPAREGINPKTKAKITIAAANAPVLKFGKAFKDGFNQ
ncbi:MAG: HU family DNA-binding protein [Clostridiales bacterium]|nr:HU family DNA-binding protein [Clostridiales bacterium]